MTSKPLISIILTYFDKKRYISKTLNSILSQTYKNYEIIFVYDDKNQNDLCYIKKKLDIFKKKTLIVNKFNLGVATSRNLALKHVKGDFVSFLDADDIWKKNKLEKQLLFMKNGNYFITYTAYDIIDQFGKKIQSKKISREINHKKLIKHCEIGLSTVMISRKIIKKIYFPNLITQEDFALWLSLLRKNYRIKGINYVLSSWRKLDNSLSSNIFQKIKDAFRLFYIYENKNFVLSIYSIIILSYNKILKKFIS